MEIAKFLCEDFVEGRSAVQGGNVPHEFGSSPFCGAPGWIAYEPLLPRTVANTASMRKFGNGLGQPAFDTCGAAALYNNESQVGGFLGEMMQVGASTLGRCSEAGYNVSALTYSKDLLRQVEEDLSAFPTIPQ